MAEPATRPGLSGHLLRRAAGQDRRRGFGAQQSGRCRLALNSEGEKDVLGLWIEQTAGAKFWLKVMNELKTRGVNDVLIAVVDRLKACPREGGGLSRGDRHGLSADHGADPGSGSGAGSASFI